MSQQSLLPLVGADTAVPLTVPREGEWTIGYANLDYAASAPALTAVADAVSRALPLYASVHRGAGYLSQVSTALYEQARAAVGRFVGAREGDVAVITRNTTDSLNLLGGCVPGRVLVLDIEHHANLLPWQRHGADVLAARATVAETVTALREALAEGQYALVAITGASNVTGESLPVTEVVTAAHEAGARVVVDAAQLAPHRLFSLQATGADYVAISGHKLYAPYGAGALVGRRDWLDAGTPYLAGGGAVTNVALEETVWEPAPQRHEAGSPNVIGAIALGVACTQLEAVAERLAEHDSRLRARLVAGLEALEGVQVLRLWPDSAEPTAVVSFSVPGHDAGLVAAYLSAEHGIGVRDGRFCAHPLLAARGLEAGLRASIGLGTTDEHVDRLIAGIESYLTTGPQASYEVVGGRWQPRDDQRELPAALGLLQDLHAEADAPSVLATAAAGAGCGPAPSTAPTVAQVLAGAH
ncbi:aminotransferase class V-fold PLP-dependent enzyme [Ruania suaedae]|uniref:aminotransferase class V-fold PLP-dependent enzyme n=1 Tax=Ruania suaedae TaxID=2897774 RepID=UPI001E310460|nr:aminotransferase class V-fold PLP-dependent enzyme [Ruania suaedae]UFU03707.1 aminotransferase class V-fold PLP-dependent enzyme [Ruania suaedae]